MDVSARISKLREILGISKTQAAKEMKTSTQTMQNITKGKTAYPSTELLLNWKAERPNINLNWIIAGIGDPILEGLDKDATVSSLIHMEPELLVQRVQAAEGMVKIMQKHLDDKEKLIQKLEEELNSLK